MPDIREILSALDINDRALWSEQRTTMRRSYLNAHNQTVGISNWRHEDDAFMDLIDIRLALLFDRAGRLDAAKDILGQDHEAIEHDLKVAEDKMKEDWQNDRTPVKIIPEKLNSLGFDKNIIAGTNLNDQQATTNATNMLKNGGWQ